MNLLVTGASGLVGSAFARHAAAAGHDVTGIVGTFGSPVPGVATTTAVDLADETAARRALADVRADVFVNCAAVAAPTACDADPVRSEALNVTLPRLLAELSAKSGARVIHLSSEQVYDGARTRPYSAAEPPHPINLYGRQKQRSEEAVQRIAGALGVVLRPPLLLGNSLTGTRSTHEALLAAWSAGRAVKLFIDEFRQTCTADNLARVMLAVCERSDVSGVFNWAGADLVSRHELARRIGERFGLSPDAAPIASISRAADPAAVQVRPGCLALDTTPLARQLGIAPQTLGEQLAELVLPPPFRDWCLGHGGRA